jgi:hypothetical protein
MKVREITPPADTDALLAGAQFADAFALKSATAISTPAARPSA